MKKFSIDVKASGKKERKKAIRYLKSIGFKWIDSDRYKTYKPHKFNFLFINDNYRFQYEDCILSTSCKLTLPQDWNKLIEYTKKDCNIAHAELKPFPGQEHGDEKTYTIKLTKPELLKCISYLTAARRKSCSVFNHGILGSVISKLKESRCQ